MQRRLLALAIGLLVAGAPQVLAACQLTCSGSTPDGVAGGEHHGPAGHHASTTAPTPSLETGPHACDHADQPRDMARPSPEPKAAAAILSTIADFSVPRGATRTHPGAFQQPLTRPVVRNSPLRV